jgi:hypothetical protein
MVSRLFMGALAAGTLVMVGCTKSSDGASSVDALAVSGTLSVSNSASSLNEKMGAQQAISDEDLISQSTDLTQYSVSCSTTTAPIRTATGTVNADGSFSINIEGGKNQPMSCFLVDSTGAKAADFLISDSSKKDLNGNSEMTTTAAFKEQAALGSISFDPNSGEVTVPKTNIASSVAATTPSAATVFDPTGSWTISAVDFTVPAGVKAPCAAGNNSCNGPPAGQAIYLKLWKGVMTSDSSDVYGLQVWDDASKFATCGSKIGLTSAIKTQLGVDFSSNGSADSTFSFATSVPNFTDALTSVTGTVSLTNHWEMSTATSQWDIQPNCGPHDVTIGGVTYSNAWVCGPDTSSYYQVQLGGGCKDTSNNPVEVNDWSGLSCGSTSTNADGIKSLTCSGTKTINGVSKTVSCSNKWAVTNSSYVVQPNANFNWNDLNSSTITSGTTCSSIANGASSEALKIAQLQCYSNYYYLSGLERANACLPKVDMDWSATTSANFVKVDDIRPQGLVFFEKFNPFPDGSGGTMLTRQEHFEGVQVKDSWVNCRVIETGGISIKKISDTKLLATYQSSTITTSLTKPACLAKFTGARETFLFYLNK